MKKETDLINITQVWTFGSFLLAVIIFTLEFSYIIGLGLGGGKAFWYAFGYVAPPTAIAAILSFLFNKLKFKILSFYKFWFWILVITLISYTANSIVNS